MASPEALELLREALRILPSATARALAKSQRDRSHRAQASASDWKPALDYQRLAVRLVSRPIQALRYPCGGSERALPQ